MRILMLTDLHGAIENFGLLRNELNNVDVLTLAGDLTNFGDRNKMKSILDRIACYVHDDTAVVGVTGNCDLPGSVDLLEERGINVECTVRMIQDVAFCGIGGSLPCPGRTAHEHTDSEFDEMLKQIEQRLPPAGTVVLVSHQPPINTKVDRVGDGLHVGSRAVRRFIETRRPTACFCGHIHEAQGIDSIGPTCVVNPGPFRQGGYAVAEITNGICTAELRMMA